MVSSLQPVAQGSWHHASVTLQPPGHTSQLCSHSLCLSSHKKLNAFRLFLPVLLAFCHTVLLHDFPNFPNVAVHFYKQNLNHSCLPNKNPVISYFLLTPLSSGFLLLLLLLSHFSRVRLCATPNTAAHQALPSLGLSRQEHWSGLPFPSPMHESEK